LAHEKEYDSPGIGTVFPLRSKFAEDPRAIFVKSLASILGSNGLIRENAKPTSRNRALRIHLNEYMHKSPILMHKKHWIDGGKQIAVFHPYTSIPFFLNNFASSICRLCTGKHNIEEIIAWSRKEWPSTSPQVLVKDLMKFLLLLEELDLIKFVG
jgi:hypothetical protein